jgi:putative transposase
MRQNSDARLVVTTAVWECCGLSRCVKGLPVPCPRCAETTTTEQPRRTALGYRTFRCCICRRILNERTGTPYNHPQYPTDLVLLVVLWRLRYKLGLRALAAMFQARGVVLSHEAVRDWAARVAPLLTTRLRAKRRGQGGAKWHADETYVKVNGTWCYLYRAIDREGNLVDVLLSEKRDMDAAQRFFAQALDIAGHAPQQVTTDGHDAYPRAIRETLGDGTFHRTSRYENNRIAQDHRGIKQRYYPMRGFGTFASAARFCTGYEEQRQYFRAQACSGACVSLAERRRRFQGRWAAVMAELVAA